MSFVMYEAQCSAICLFVSEIKLASELRARNKKFPWSYTLLHSRELKRRWRLH